MIACMEAALAYLEFDYSEDAEGHGSFDAMAAAAPAQFGALQAEVLRVLDWAHRSFGAPAPLEEGGEWDVELQGVRELATPLAVRYQAGRGLALQAEGPETQRTTLTLTLSGTAAFCGAFRQAFAF
jgi:hypothetical protein